MSPSHRSSTGTRRVASSAVAILSITGALGCAAGGGPSFGDGSGGGDTNGFDENYAATGTSVATTSATTGAGGASGTLASSTVASSTIASSSVASSSVAASSSASGGPADCQYPASGGFSAENGQVVPGSLSFAGYEAGSSAPGTVTMNDLYDCDGSKGINAVVILEGAVWCGDCQQEGSETPNMVSQLSQYGVAIVSAIAENADQTPATIDTATSWKQSFGLTNTVIADPGWTFQNPNLEYLPFYVVVNPRTMQVTQAGSGTFDQSSVIQLAMSNQ